MGQEDFLSLLAYGFPSSPPPAGPSPQEHTCRSYSSEVVGPAQHHAGPVAGALDQRPGQGGEQEDHGQVQHRHEEGEVEALYGAQSTAGRPGAVRQQPSLGSPAPARRPRGRGPNSVLAEGSAGVFTNSTITWHQRLSPNLEVTQAAGGQMGLNCSSVLSPPPTAC